MSASRHQLVFRLRLIVWAALCCLIATAAEALPFLPRCDAALHVRSVPCVLQHNRASAVAVLAALRAIAAGRRQPGPFCSRRAWPPIPSLAHNGISRGLF